MLSEFDGVLSTTPDLLNQRAYGMAFVSLCVFFDTAGVHVGKWILGSQSSFSFFKFIVWPKR